MWKFITNTLGAKQENRCFVACAVGTCKATSALTECGHKLSAESSAVLFNLTWVLLWEDCFMAVLLFSTGVKWWNQKAFGYLSYCLGFSHRSRGDGWTRTGADGCIRMRGGCIKRYCTPAAAAPTTLVSIFMLCSDAPYCENRKQVRAYPCIFVLNTCWGGQWRNSEAEALTLFWVSCNGSGSETVHLAIVETLSLPQGLYSMLCVGAAGTN